MGDCSDIGESALMTTSFSECQERKHLLQERKMNHVSKDSNPVAFSPNPASMASAEETLD